MGASKFFLKFFSIGFLTFSFGSRGLPDPVVRAGPCEKGAFSPSDYNFEETRLEGRIGYSFQNPRLRAKALDRTSYYKNILERERLEFLGDAVFNMFMIDILLVRYPFLDTQTLYKKWKAFVNRNTQAHIAHFIKLNPPEYQRDTSVPIFQVSPKILADRLESLTGAVYLDGGYRKVRQMLVKFFEWATENEWVGDWDYKSFFAQHVLSKYGRPLDYEVHDILFRSKSNMVVVNSRIKRIAPTTRKLLLAQIKLDGRVLGEAQGVDLQTIFQMAAKDALRRNGLLEKNFQPQTQDPLAKMSLPKREEIAGLSSKHYMFYYKRLKLLGSAVLKMALTDILLVQHPDRREGYLTNQREAFLSFIKKNPLSRSLHLEVETFWRRDIRQRYYKRLNAVSVFLAAIYLEEGYLSAKEKVLDIFGPFQEDRFLGSFAKTSKKNFEQ